MGGSTSSSSSRSSVGGATLTPFLAVPSQIGPVGQAGGQKTAHDGQRAAEGGRPDGYGQQFRRALDGPRSRRRETGVCAGQHDGCHCPLPIVEKAWHGSAPSSSTTCPFIFLPPPLSSQEPLPPPLPSCQHQPLWRPRRLRRPRRIPFLSIRQSRPLPEPTALLGSPERPRSSLPRKREGRRPPPPPPPLPLAATLRPPVATCPRVTSPARS